MHRDWRHIGFARFLRTQAPTDAGLLPRGSLATGRSQKLDVCWISWPPRVGWSEPTADLLHAIQRMVAYHSGTDEQRIR